MPKFLDDIKFWSKGYQRDIRDIPEQQIKIDVNGTEEILTIPPFSVELSAEQPEEKTVSEFIRDVIIEKDIGLGQIKGLSESALSKIDTAGRNWTETLGIDAFVDFRDSHNNIENGEGAGSLEQVTYDSDNDAKNPVAYGLGAVAFGGFRGDKPNNTPTDLPGLGTPSDKESHISGIGESTTDIGNIRNIVEDGRYYEVNDTYKFKNIISDTTTCVEGIQATAIGAANRVYGNWSLAGGKDNVVIGKSGLAFGNGNVVSAPNYKNGDYAFTAVFGASNISTGSHSLVSGENNVNTGNWSIVAGKGIKNEGKFSAIFGGGDTSGAVPSNIHNVGQGNLIAGYSLNSHSSQFDVDCNYVSLLGRTLTATNNYQTIVGRNNGYAVQDIPNLRFAVGTGWYKHKITGEEISTSTFDNLSDTDKASYEVVGNNGFEVYEGGMVYVYKKPTTPSEVARFAEIEELDTKKLDKIIDKGEGAGSIKQSIYGIEDVYKDFRHYAAAYGIATAQGNDSVEAIEQLMSTYTYEQLLGMIAQANFGGDTEQAQTYIYGMINDVLQQEGLEIIPNEVNGSSSVVLGLGNKIESPLAFTTGYKNIIGRKGYPIGSTYSVAMGKGLNVYGNSSVALGTNSSIEGSYSVAIGNANTAFGSANAAIGILNKTYQSHAFAFGRDNQTGMSKEEFNDYFWDEVNQVPLHGGKGKNNDGEITDHHGLAYENSPSMSLTINVSNKNYGERSFEGGENNTNYGRHSLVFGRGIYNEGDKSVILGGEDGYGNLSDSFIITNKGNYNFFFGSNLRSGNNPTHYNNVVLLGTGLTATNDNQVIVGKNSKSANLGAGSGLRFAVGVESFGLNALEIYHTGSVRVYKAPTEDSEVARLKEIKDLDAEISISASNIITKIKQEDGIITQVDTTPLTVNTDNLKLTAVGSKGNPIYINEDGKPSACGFSIKVNGTEVSWADINFITG